MQLPIILAAWAPENFIQWIGVCAAFSVLGILLLVLAFKLFDYFSPLDFIAELRGDGTRATPNYAVAAVVSAFLLAVAIIIGHAIGQ
jgi:ABC-type multidrug transport system permease subunit